MKKILLFSLFLALPLVAWPALPVQHGDSAYALSLSAGYGYNSTYLSHGDFDISAFLPVNPYCELQADIRLSTADVYSFGFQARPKFLLPVGCLYLQTQILYRDLHRNLFHEFSGAVSLGYRMDYVDFSLGCGMRLMRPFALDYHSTEQMVAEPFILTYSLRVFVRPQSADWNLYFRLSDWDDFQIERVWSPIFGLGAWYDIDSHCRLGLMADCKPTGMFHLNAAFYAASALASFSYRF